MQNNLRTNPRLTYRVTLDHDLPHRTADIIIGEFRGEMASLKPDGEPKFVSGVSKTFLAEMRKDSYHELKSTPGIKMEELKLGSVDSNSRAF
ncbi:hypothetical protein DRE_00751 [Drechslerella stenobrocha 248]|uniref:Uncharacterized protein n=1 Tax=Drechslerella stenobrocha 248 TaxID=1043628 RepID=W7HYT3_9PEZI|nr:hypothetical protein DRE_00751 [Drechslerella stenobrocha 248]